MNRPMKMNVPHQEIVLESEDLCVRLLPDVGFKVREIFWKEKNFDLLYKPAAARAGADLSTAYFNPFPGMNYQPFDRSGLDDVIPTLYPCRVSQIGNFHKFGDVWARSWHVIESNLTRDHCSAFIRLSAIPLYLERTVSLSGTSLFLHYRLINETVSALPWMWSLYLLAVYDPAARLDLPVESPAVDPETGKKHDLNFSQPALFPADQNVHFFFERPVQKGWARISYPTQAVACQISWDPSLFPYLGGSFIGGAQASERKICLRPGNGYHENLEKALSAGKAATIPPEGELVWDVQLRLCALPDRS